MLGYNVGMQIKSRRTIFIWQLSFLLCATSWLWAPILNHALSSRTSLISQYETATQPYAWLFRLGDVLAGLLVVVLAYFFKKIDKKMMAFIVAIIGVGMIADPLLTTSCKVVGNACIEYGSTGYVLHAIETVITSLAFFVAATYDALTRKKVVSIVFAVFQIAYGLLFLSQFVGQQHFNTLSQYVYQTSLLVWLAWLARDYIREDNFLTSKLEQKIVRSTVSIWAFVNGILAILLSLAHIELVGRIRGLYFASDSAWLAQHGVIIGVILIYICRHLWRGELRARQIFLAIVGVETLKYSIVAPNPALMTLYFISFCVLLVLRDDFDRGSVPLTWHMRLGDLYTTLGGLLIACLAAVLALERSHKTPAIKNAFNHLFDYVLYSTHVPHYHIHGALLAHTISAFLVTSLLVILWILFRPYRYRLQSEGSTRAEALLKKYSTSSEDFFKLWPQDKEYFFSSKTDGFVAYKIAGSVCFALADPIGQSPPALIHEFTAWCRARRLTVCFLPVAAQSLPLYKATGLETYQIGASAVINLEAFLSVTIHDKWWRWKRNSATKAGFAYHVAQPPHSDKLLKELQNVSDAWLTKQGRTERGFALGYFDQTYMQQCAIHYITDNQHKMVAFTNQLPLFQRAQTATVDLLRYVPDANNAMPYLQYKTMETCKASDGFTYFDLGFVPFAKAKSPLLTVAKTLTGDRFSARGLEQFKNKFNPDWNETYIAYDGDKTDLAAIALNVDKVMERS